MSEGLEVPEEVSDLFDEASASEICMKECVNSVFKAKRAIYYAKRGEKNKEKAWRLVRELYPQLEGKGLNYNHESKLVTILSAEKDAAD